MNKFRLLALFLASVSTATAQMQPEPVDYVNTLMGTQSKPSLSNGNTYPAIGLPWGMNMWTPQTGKMGDGWAYTYDADKIRGFKQTHQPSPWMNDYGQFSIMPVTGRLVVNEDDRASWFSHKAERATPYYYSVYLADADVTAELAPTERAAQFRFTFPKLIAPSLSLMRSIKDPILKYFRKKKRLSAIPLNIVSRCRTISKITL